MPFQLLLSLAKSLFEEQVSLERLVSTIITEAKSLLKCDRCTVYLLDLRMYDEVSHGLRTHDDEIPNFFVAQIQIPIPNIYLGFGYKGLVFCRNNG